MLVLRLLLNKIIHPEVANYSTLTLVILALAIIVKLLLGRYVKTKGEQVKAVYPKYNIQITPDVDIAD